MANPQQHASPPRRRFTDERRTAASSIGRDVAITGTIRGATDVDVWGAFEGDMVVEGLVWLHAGSRFSGELAAIDVVVEGVLRGTVAASGIVDLRATCEVEAEISASRVAAAEDGRIEGRITVSGGSKEVAGYSERRRR